MIETLARLLGIRPDQTEDALRSERAARATLNRRGFLLAGATAGAALATGAIFSLPPVQRFPASTVINFNEMLRRFYAAPFVPQSIFLNPRDHAMVAATLDVPTGAIITDPHCPPGQVFIMKEKFERDPLLAILPKGEALS